MKTTFCAAIILIALLPTHAQECPATPTAGHSKQVSDGSNELTATALLLTYAGKWTLPRGPGCWDEAGHRTHDTRHGDPTRLTSRLPP